MRTLLFFALIIIAAGGYLAYFNDASVSLNVYKDQPVDIAIIPLMLGCVSLGLVMGLMGTLWQDVKGAFFRMGANRRRKRGDRVRSLFDQAERERLAGRTSKAQGLYRKVTKADPENPAAIAAMGRIARDNNACKEALSLHRLAFRLDPDNPAYRLAMVDDYLAMGAFESAAQMAEPGITEDPKNQTLLTRMRQAKIGIGEWDGAVRAQQQLIKSPMDGLDSREEKDRLNGLQYEAALAQLDSGHNEQGKNSLNRLIREAADFVPAYMSLADLLLRDGKSKESLGVLRDGYEQSRDESFLPPIENLIIVHQEDPRAALHYFSALVERDPKSARLRYYLARVYYRLEMIDDAMHVLTQLEQDVDSFPEVKELNGLIHLRRGQLGEASTTLAESTAQVAYTCAGCKVSSASWHAYCEPCGTWGSISPKLHVSPDQTSSRSEGTALLPAPV